MHKLIRKFQKETTPSKIFYNDKGTPYGYVYDDSFLKFEQKKDRLRIFNYKAHAIDENLFQELVGMGVQIVIIDEKDNNVFRIWRTSTQKLETAPRRKLAGVKRIIIELSRCELLSGDPEPWYLARKAAV
jgi:tRNA A37 methylthiotransferase MiaB